jgi:hypothetical protein
VSGEKFACVQALGAGARERIRRDECAGRVLGPVDAIAVAGDRLSSSRQKSDYSRLNDASLTPATKATAS